MTRDEVLKQFTTDEGRFGRIAYWQMADLIVELIEQLHSVKRILAALREPSAVVSEAGSRHYRTDDVIRAAVAAAEKEVQGDK